MRGCLACGMLLVLVATPVLAGAPDEVLVLGLRDSTGALRTCLVDAAGISPVGEGLAVPRGDGWWRLQRLERSAANTSETVVFASPARKPVRPPDLVADEGCEADKTQLLLFVGAEFASVEESAGGYCQGAAHPYAGVGLRSFRLAPDLEQKSLVVEEALGKEARAVFEKAAAAAHGGAEKREADCLGDAGPTDWGLVRQEGKWILRGGLGYLAEACRGNHEYFTVPFDLPAKLTGQAGKAPGFSAVQKEVPGALDAVVSPSGTFSLVVTPGGLELRAGGKPVASHAVAGAAVVMTQWGLGKAAARWRSEVRQVLAPK